MKMRTSILAFCMGLFIAGLDGTAIAIDSSRLGNTGVLFIGGFMTVGLIIMSLGGVSMYRLYRMVA